MPVDQDRTCNSLGDTRRSRRETTGRALQTRGVSTTSRYIDLHLPPRSSSNVQKRRHGGISQKYPGDREERPHLRRQEYGQLYRAVREYPIWPQRLRQGHFSSPIGSAGTIGGDRHRRFHGRDLKHGQRGLVQRTVLHDEKCSMLRRPPLCRQDTRRGFRTRTTRVGRPTRNVRRLFEGGAQSGARQHEFRANQFGPRPRRIPI